MTDARSTLLTAAVRTLRAAALCALVALSVQAQPLVWESFPPAEDFDPRFESNYAVGFLSGSASTDSIVVMHHASTRRYAPGQDNNGDGVINEWDPNWRQISPPYCASSRAGMVTSQSSILTDNGNICRSPDSGETWQEDVAGPGHAADAFFEARYPVPGQPPGAGPLVMAAVTGTTRRSFGDSAPGTWETTDRIVGGWIESFGEVPPSEALPTGRLLAAVANGVTESTDGGITWTPVPGLYTVQGMIAYALTFVEVWDHPYGGVAFAGVDVFPGEELTVWRSDDGGATWAEAHEFAASEWQMRALDRIRLFGAPDGTLYAGLVDIIGGSGGDHGRIVRSFDLGETWEAADGGMRVLESRLAPGVHQFALGPDGRLFAATDSLLWRTAEPLPVSAGAAVPESSGLGLSVRPNPSAGGAVTVTLSAAEPTEVRAWVVDARGRRVAALWDEVARGVLSAELDTSGWAAGVYTVVVEAGGARRAEAFTVAR